jgi:hypothetical protein
VVAGRQLLSDASTKAIPSSFRQICCILSAVLLPKIVADGSEKLGPTVGSPTGTIAGTLPVMLM